MFTISCYSLHPLVLRFVTLWRRVQLVSDCLTGVLWALCCRCCWDDRMPLSTSSSVRSKPSVEAYKFINIPPINTGLAGAEPLCAQHLVVDFTPEPGDPPEAQEKCNQYWYFLNSQEQLKLIKSNKDPELSYKVKSPKRCSSRLGDQFEEGDDFPTVHILRNINERSSLAAAFTKSCKKYDK